MNLSRRQLAALLPANRRRAANGGPDAAAVEGLPERPDPVQGRSNEKGRRFFYGHNRSGFNLEMHETILGPGIESHPPHKHVHEEIMIVLEGTAEATIEGKSETAEAGSVIYFASNETHNALNVVTTPCRYYVLELRGDAA